MTTEDAYRAIELAHEVEAILKGERAAVVGAVLGQLLAIFLASHQGPDIEAHREQLLKDHMASVRRLVPIIESERRKKDA